MKTLSITLAVVFLIASCGSKKNPVGSDLSTIRQQGQKAREMGPPKPTVITNTKVVEKPVEIVREESTVDDKFIVITPDPQLSFNEGESSSYNIRARVLIPGVKIQLTAENLPPGATLTPSTNEQGLYHLKWLPAYHTIPANEPMKTFITMLRAQISSAENPEIEAKLKSLVREQALFLYLFKNRPLPRDMKVEGLPSEMFEGSAPQPFAVVVTIPGTDDKAPQKPILVVSYDGVSYTPGQNYLELDGSRHVIPDTNRLEPEYMGQFKWKFYRLFDTKNISVQPQLAKDGSLMKGADRTHTRLSFKVYNSFGGSTPETPAKVQIKYVRSVSAPRFDFSALPKAHLEVSRGENIQLKFRVLSGDSKANLRVEAKGTTLPGAPQINCQPSSQGPFQQSCILKWNIPCDISENALSGTLELLAWDHADSTSNATAHTLSAVLASPEKALCKSQGGKSL